MQFFIPGQGGIDGTGRRQYFAPGFGGVNELGSADLSATFTETLSLGDSFGAAMAASATISDAAMASDAYLPVSQYRSAFAGYALNEGQSRQFFIAGQGGVNATGRARIVPPVSVGASYGIPESTAPADNLAASVMFNAPTSDFVFASDLPPPQPIYSATYGDIILGETRYGSVGVLPAAARQGGASSVYSEIVLGDTQFAGDGGATYNPTFTAPYVMVSFGETLVEQIAVSDIIAALASFGAMLDEGIATSDDMGGMDDMVVALSEVLMARDSMSAFIDIPTPLYRIIRAEAKGGDQ